MVRVVADSSALILLAKCSLLETVCNLFEVRVPSVVVSEAASKDLAKEYPDAALISDLISKGAVRIQEPEEVRTTLPTTLHHGEEHAILLALELTDAILATDDGKAIKVARFLKIPFIITPKIVVELFRLHEISFEKARVSLEKLAKIGRYSPEIIADALITLMEERNGQANND